MIEDIKQGNGLEYSIIMTGKERAETKKSSAISRQWKMKPMKAIRVYIWKISLFCRKRKVKGIGWEMFKGLINKLKEKI